MLLFFFIGVTLTLYYTVLRSSVPDFIPPSFTSHNCTFILHSFISFLSLSLSIHYRSFTVSSFATIFFTPCSSFTAILITACHHKALLHYSDRKDMFGEPASEYLSPRHLSTCLHCRNICSPHKKKTFMVRHLGSFFSSDLQPHVCKKQHREA